MKRFLTLVAVAVVAGAMYVAASPASQRSSGPTAKQFKALKKQVAVLSKRLKTVKIETEGLFGTVLACYFTVNSGVATANGLPVSQLGSTSNGYLFGTDATTATPRTGLDAVTSGTPQHYLQEVDPGCVKPGALRHGAPRAAIIRLLSKAEKTH
jgi:hypothetical protein